MFSCRKECVLQIIMSLYDFCIYRFAYEMVSYDILSKVVYFRKYDRLAS